jgi:hypothetical protein
MFGFSFSLFLMQIAVNFEAIKTFSFSAKTLQAEV